MARVTVREKIGIALLFGAGIFLAVAAAFLFFRGQPGSALILVGAILAIAACIIFTVVKSNPHLFVRKKNLIAVILFAIAAIVELTLGGLLLEGKVASNLVTFAAMASGIVCGGIGLLALVNPRLFVLFVRKK